MQAILGYSLQSKMQLSMPVASTAKKEVLCLKGLGGFWRQHTLYAALPPLASWRVPSDQLTEEDQIAVA